MASGPNHPNEQMNKRRRSTSVANTTATKSADPSKQPKEAAAAPLGDGPTGPHEQAAVTISGDEADEPAPAAKSRGKNGAGSRADSAGKRLRFTVSLHAKLAKQTDFSVCVFSSDTNRGEVVIESIHVSLSRKGESIFDGDVPVRKEAAVNPGTKKVLSFTGAQQKELARVLKSKTFVLVNAVYTAPPKTAVTFSIENQEPKKK